MTKYIQIWNGKEWTDKMYGNEKEVEEIAEELRKNGLHVIVVGGGYLPKPKSNLDGDIIKILLKREHENKDE